VKGHLVIKILTTGKSFRAYDNKLKKEVALKVEKENKNKKILKFEYEILKALQSSVFIYIKVINMSPKSTNSLRTKIVISL
jgi:hypothetical protein